MAAWFAIQGPALSNCWTTSSRKFRRPRPFAVEQLDHVIKATLALGSGGAPLCRGRDHAFGSFIEGLVELFHHGGSCIAHIQSICILKKKKDDASHRLGGGPAPGCLAEGVVPA
jgi:hypothetical protein